MSRKDITDAEVVKACLDAENDIGKGCVAAADLLVVRTGEPYKVCIAALERAYDRDLVFCGPSIRRSWPTDKGRALIGAPPRAKL